MARSETKEFTTSSSKSPCERVYDLATRYLSDFGEVIAGYRAGQFLFRKTDDVLRTVEKSVQWSVQPQINPSPLEDADSDKKSNECLMTNGSKKKMYPGELIRPLPWVFFIPMLLLIRVVLKGAELQAWLLNREVTTPKHMVRYIQGMRRRLRAIKYRGMRNARASVATPRSDTDKSHANTTLSSTSSPSISKSKQPSDGSDLGSDPLSKTPKRKLSDRENSSSDDDDDDAVDAIDAEETSDHPGSSLGRLLESQDLSDSDNDPDFQPNSSMEANSTDSDGLGSDASDDEPPHSVEVKRLSQPTSLINADIIEEEIEDSIDSSTISISEVSEDHDVGSKSERNSKDNEMFHSVSSCRTEPGLKGVVGGGVDDDRGQELGHNDEVPSDYESCTVSLSAKSVDIASSIEKSDRSDSSAMQKMSSLFSIKNRKKSEVK